MRFDDRLTTVLAQPASDPHDRAVRWRQLVDLVSRARMPASALVETALVELAAERTRIGEEVRAAAARSIAGRAVPLALLQIFAADSVQVAAPLLSSDIDPDAAERLFEVASAENQALLASLHPGLQRDRTTAASPLPAPPHEDELPDAERRAPDAAPVETAPVDDGIPSISEVVARIERLRSAREEGAAPVSAPPPPPAPPARVEPVEKGLFRWESNASGEIAWVEGVPRGALIGRSLAQASADDGMDPAIAAAFARRTSFHEAELILPGRSAIGGQWRISGVPAFEPADGRFAGYRGIALRGGPALDEQGGSDQESASEHDSIRELVHELKTPLNAIIGFAEMIDGQYLGPANDRYRARAAEIVGQARLLVTAIDDLDFAARLQSGREPAADPVQVSGVLGELVPDLQERAADRGAMLEIDGVASGTACALDPAIASQLIRRFCEAAIDLCAPGESMRISLQMLRDRCSLSVALPLALRSDDAEDLLAGAQAEASGDEPDPFFWLRLVRGLARIAGGEVMIADGKLSLILPKSARSG